MARFASAQARLQIRRDWFAPPDSTPIQSLPLAVVDCETTGLDPRRDRIVSIAALCIDGARTMPRACLDTLVDPGVPIPPRATRVHGITDAMVADAPAFSIVARQLQPMLRGVALIGHAVAFDHAILVRESQRAGIPWREAPSVCTRELAAALLPSDADIELTALAARLGVPVLGRHTALGDARATAQIFTELTRLATRSGATTLGSLRAIAVDGARRIAQRRAHGY
jgi:DNA polymerase III epsilon subunit family exonuclease